MAASGSSLMLPLGALTVGGIMLTSGIKNRRVVDVATFTPDAPTIPGASPTVGGGGPPSAVPGTPAASTPPRYGGIPASSADVHAHGTIVFDGHPVAAWIVPILKAARASGKWKGQVASGYRTDAEQTAIYNSGVRPAALPKSLGGSGSNHEGTVFPAGAVDVTDAAGLNAYLRGSKWARVLIWAAGKDPIHFSHPHNGGY